MTSVLATRAARRRWIAFLVLLVISVMLMGFSSNPAVRDVQNGIGFAFRPHPGRARRRGARGVVGRRRRRPRSTASGWTTAPSGPRTTGWRPRTRGSQEIQRENEQLTALLQLRAGLDYDDRRHDA